MPDLDFVDIVTNLLSDTRLPVEGAITLYGNDLTAHISTTTKAEKPEAHIVLGDIGRVLYELRRHIKRLQVECSNEAYCQAAPDV